jgi:hypothetical protein
VSVAHHDQGVGWLGVLRTTGRQRLLGPLAAMILTPVTVLVTAKFDRRPKESLSKAGGSDVKTDAVLMRSKVVRSVCW